MNEPDDTLSDEEAARRLTALGQRLDERAPRRSAEPASPDSTSARSGIAQALRLSSEFIAGVVVGAAIGYAVDWAFETSPWGLIVFFLLGFCAAILNVMRAAGLMAPSQLRMKVPADDHDRPDARKGPPRGS